MKKKKLAKMNIEINNKTIIIIGILVVICYLAMPFIVWILQHILPQQIFGNISADGLLSYAGTIFGWLPTLILSLITINQTKKNAELQEIIEIGKKRQAVFPDLYINWDEENSINIKNYSTNIANNIVISYDEYSGNEIPLLPGNGILKLEQLEYFPPKILINYRDSIESCICREFVKSENDYILIKTEYDL